MINVDHRYVNCFSELAKLPSSVIGQRVVACIEEGEVCDHLLSIFKYDNIAYISFSGDAVEYMFGWSEEDDEEIQQSIKRRDLIAILNRHLSGGRDMLMCQDELIDAGFERWARV